MRRRTTERGADRRAAEGGASAAGRARRGLLSQSCYAALPPPPPPPVRRIRNTRTLGRPRALGPAVSVARMCVFLRVGESPMDVGGAVCDWTRFLRMRARVFKGGDEMTLSVRRLALCAALWLVSAQFYPFALYIRTEEGFSNPGRLSPKQGT